MTNATSLENHPIYEHDCEFCNFLGNFNLPETAEKIDLYYCNQNNFSATVIGRYSSEPSEYISGLMTVKYEIKKLLQDGTCSSPSEALTYYSEHNQDSPVLILIKATEMAMKQGLLKEDYFL